MTCQARRHGTIYTYQRYGCRCPSAVEAMRRNWRRQPSRSYQPTGRSSGWSKGDHFSPIAVDLARVGVGGEELTTAERAAAIRLLTDHGRSQAWIAEQLGVSRRTVARHRRQSDSKAA